MEKSYPDGRFGTLAALAAGKEVLDFGVGDTSDRFLHKIIVSAAKSCTGVELDPARAQALRAQGYDVVTGNAETIDMGRTYGLAVAGDLIEHLDNPGVFLDNVRRHLAPGGLFYFNTPNAYAANLLLRGLFLGGDVAQFPEHVTLFTEDLVRELLTRHGFAVERVDYFTHPDGGLAGAVIRAFGAVSRKWHANIGFTVRAR